MSIDDGLRPISPTLAVSRPSSWATVHPDGEIDLATAPLLFDQVMAASAEAAVGVVVDFANVTFVGAAAVSALVRARDLLDADGLGLVVRSPTRMLVRMLGLFDLLEMVEAPDGHDGISVAS